MQFSERLLGGVQRLAQGLREQLAAHGALLGAIAIGRRIGGGGSTSHSAAGRSSVGGGLGGGGGRGLRGGIGLGSCSRSRGGGGGGGRSGGGRVALVAIRCAGARAATVLVAGACGVAACRARAPGGRTRTGEIFVCAAGRLGAALVAIRCAGARAATVLVAGAWRGVGARRARAFAVRVVLDVLATRARRRAHACISTLIPRLRCMGAASHWRVSRAAPGGWYAKTPQPVMCVHWQSRRRRLYQRTILIHHNI